MSRMEINALLKVAESAEAGGYTLPSELTDALRTYRRTAEVTMPKVQQFQPDQAAGRIVAAAAAGEEPDMSAMVTTAVSAASEAAAAAQVQYALTLAQELAENAATLVVRDRAESIITEHLAPAYRQMLGEVREVATALEGHGTDAHRLLTAPAKVRNAYLKLPELAVRNQTIHEARKLVNVVGQRKPQHDTGDLFSLFSKPMALRPGWRPPARINQLDTPSDPSDFLLWLVSDEAAPGEPWLPTIAEQDAAWWAQFGEAQEKRAHGALAARAYAGQRV